MSSSDSKIDELRKRLYARGEQQSSGDNSNLSSPKEGEVKQDWDHNHKDNNQSTTQSLLNKLMFFAGLIAVLAAGFAAVVIGLRSDSISPDQVDVSISGPETISAGETVSLNVGVTNSNKVALQDVVLTASFPPGTRQPDTSGSELRRVRKELGTINPQETRQTSLEASLFGKQDETRSVDINLEYQVEGSNAIFTASNEYAVSISELPVSISIESPQETGPDQPFDFTVNVQSNSPKPLQDVTVIANYPFGFRSASITPEPDYRDYVWSLGELEPSEEKTIEITGRFQGGISTGERNFQFQAGISNPNDPTKISTLFASRRVAVDLNERPIALSVDISNQESSGGRAVVDPGDEVSGSLEYTSNLEEVARNGSISLSFVGSAVDADSVEADNGLYRQSESRAVWNVQSFSNLETISPQESQAFDFSFSIKSPEELVGQENPTADLSAVLEANPPEGAGYPQQLITEVNQSLPVSSHVSVTAETLRVTGPFENDGPVSPVVDKATDYTLHLSLANTTNNITNTRLQASVPPYVEIDGEPQVSQGSFAFNEVSGRLEWSVGELPPGTGYGGQEPAEIFIPVTVTPTLDQVGDRLDVISNITVTGQDSFTDKRINQSDVPAPNTVPDDTGGGDSQGVVQSQES